MISRICQEFRCTPSVALLELRRNEELVFDVLQMRAYADVREQLRAAKDEQSAPRGPMADLVADIEWELMEDRRAHGSE